ncbi:MAG TPA: dihydrodipicolinate reductase [Gammaproteobacteria bacterium]|nr:dihydrodipicolinate reductase [Gammaproteobacteria bacterium]
MSNLKKYFFILMVAVAPKDAFAERKAITTSEDFVELVTGKALTRPFIILKVSSDGKIRGSGAFRKIVGTWSWEDESFCRNLYWGQSDLGYNCQKVISDGNRISFTSDRGSGESALFTLRQITD